ncbi:MAG: UDP-N-acetylmuramoyl-L-alanyl-D-glutamate--2,6-diaminopimelate ligase, partial [Muribaculaceae bacterium]|nr:UDP-N-acetylmuramoyl-L-alanyl-D-glutamate--2,6-diaminopimelate ligase [Muribaculaceae bacterium]
GKRTMMSHQSVCLSDYIFLTSDNPRNEVPEEIIADMRAGLSSEELKRTECITDRREAIREAIKRAKPGTVVLVAGKGHETYQEVKGVRHHFDDREEVKEALAMR